VGQRSERAMGRRVAVAADDRHARLGAALFGADDMDDAVAGVAHAKGLYSRIGRIAVEGGELGSRFLVLYTGKAERLPGRGNIMVENGERAFGAADRMAGTAQSREGLWARNFVEQVKIDVEKGIAAVAELRGMGVPDLVI